MAEKFALEQASGRAAALPARNRPVGSEETGPGAATADAPQPLARLNGSMNECEVTVDSMNAKCERTSMDLSKSMADKSCRIPLLAPLEPFSGSMR